MPVEKPLAFYKQEIEDDRDEFFNDFISLTYDYIKEFYNRRASFLLSVKIDSNRFYENISLYSIYYQQ